MEFWDQVETQQALIIHQEKENLLELQLEGIKHHQLYIKAMLQNFSRKNLQFPLPLSKFQKWLQAQKIFQNHILFREIIEKTCLKRHLTFLKSVSRISNVLPLAERESQKPLVSINDELIRY